MAGGAGLIDDEKQAIAVAVHAELDQALDVAGGLALAPELPAASGTSR